MDNVLKDHSQPALNLYSYVKNNPLNGVDPDGHCSDSDGQHRSWIWCAAHAAGFVETKKEEAERKAAYQKAKTTWEANHPGRSYWFYRLNLETSIMPGVGELGVVGEGAEAVEGLAVASAGVQEIEITAANGTKITGITEHGIDRIIGDGAPGVAGTRAGTKPEAILEALKNPKSIKAGIDSQGRPYQMFTGQNARVVVNPQSGKIVSVNPTSGAGAH